MRPVGIGTSLFLIAAGAILRWGVTAHVNGIDIQTIGLILLVVGVIGLVVSFLMMAMWTDRRRETDSYVRERDYPRDYPR